jgi:hypothetical protein
MSAYAFSVMLHANASRIAGFPNLASALEDELRRELAR